MTYGVPKIMPSLKTERQPTLLGHSDSVRDHKTNKQGEAAVWFQEVREELVEDGVELSHINDDSAGDLEDRFVSLIKQTDDAEYKLDCLREECMRCYGQLMEKAELGTWAAYIGPLDERPLFDSLACWGRESSMQRVKIKNMRKDVFQSVFARLNEAKSDNYITWLAEFMDLILVAAIVKIASNTKYRFKHYVHFLVDGWPDLDAPAHDEHHRRLFTDEYNHLHNDHTRFEFHHSHILVENSLFDILVDTFCIYFMFFAAFLAHTMLWIRFTDAPGRLDDFLHKIYGLGIVWIALYIPSKAPPFDNCEGIAIGWCIAIGALVLLHVFYYRLSDDIAREYCKKRMVIFFMSIACALLALIPSGADVIFCFFAALVIVAIEVNSVRMVDQDVINATTEALTERLGIFILVLLGESILAIILTNLEFGNHTIQYTDTKVQEVTWFIVQAFCLMIMLYILYFNGHSSEVEGGHALDNAEFPGSVTWLASHIPLGFALLLLGTTFKLEVYNIEHASKHASTEELLDTHHDKSVEFSSILMFTSLGVATFFIFLIRASHIHYDYCSWTFCVLRPLLIMWFFILPWFIQTDDPVTDLSMAIAILFVITCVDFWAIEHEWMHDEDSTDASMAHLASPRIKGTLRYMSRSEIFARSTNIEHDEISQASVRLLDDDGNTNWMAGAKCFEDSVDDKAESSELTVYANISFE